MHSIPRLTLITLAALTILGCSPQSSVRASSSSASPSPSPSPAEPATYTGSQSQTIPDPTLNNMTAFDVTIPARWHFQGTLYQGGNCTPTPAAVFRASSPDGLSYAERMPTLSWFWGTGPFLQYMPHTDCLPLNGPVSAQQFLHYMAGTLHVDYLSDEPVPAELAARAQAALRNAEASVAAQYAASGLTPPKSTRELARAIVTYKNGSFTMKGRLSVMIDCVETHYAGQPTVGPYGGPGHPAQLVTGASSTVDKCTAGIDYLTAPDAQFSALLHQWDASSMGQKPQSAWQQAWIQRNNQQSQQRIADIQRQGAIQRQNTANQFAQAQAQRDASFNQFNHDQAVRLEMHNQFMASMQQQNENFRAGQQANSAARDTAVSDWVDFALDRQTVRDPNTGQLSKLSSSYSYTWVDETGKTAYQTNDVNANPNGYLQGTWTQQTVTHGNGTSK